MKQILSLTLLMILLLTACGSESGVNNEPGLQSIQISAADEGQTDIQGQTRWPDGEELSDEQGQVEVAVTPMNLNNPGGTLDFQVSLNTHSVDLSMDLTELATLESDNGLSVSATVWDGAKGGHHVGGTLSFPATTENMDLFSSASRLTLTIRDVDAVERIFVWNTNS
jgi:hypothetical protein